jgi:hypothetical protein
MCPAPDISRRFSPFNPMPSSYRQQILAEIRAGKRSWLYAATGDYEVFRRQIVEPLRQLKYDGIIQALSEVESPENGTPRVVAIHIIGTVNLGQEANS